MSTAAEYILFDFDALTLADRARIVQLMETFIGAGWRFLKKAIVCDDMPGDTYVPSEPELLDRAWSNAVRAAPRYGGAYWMEMENGAGLKVSWGFDPKRLKRFNLTVSRNQIAATTQTENMQAFVGAAEQVYQSLQPAYGYGLFNYDVHEGYPIGAGPQALWDVNWYSSVIAERFSNSDLENLPAYKIMQREDGSLFVQMAAVPIAQAGQRMTNYRVVARVLGLSAVHAGG